MDYLSLKDEIVAVVKVEMERLLGLGELGALRKEEIEKFLEKRFGVDCPSNLVDTRLNEMMSSFEELYIPLASINIQKYT